MIVPWPPYPLVLLWRPSVLQDMSHRPQPIFHRWTVMRQCADFLECEVEPPDPIAVPLDVQIEVQKLLADLQLVYL